MAKIELRSGKMNLMDGHFRVDINFVTVDSFSQAIDNGFCPMTWENKNKNKVLINNIHYTLY